MNKFCDKKHQQSRHTVVCYVAQENRSVHARGGYTYLHQEQCTILRLIAAL